MNAEVWSNIAAELAKASPYALFALIVLAVVCIFFKHHTKMLVQQHDNAIKEISASYKNAFSFMKKLNK